MKQITLKTIKSMLGKTISKTMNYSGEISYTNDFLGASQAGWKAIHYTP